MQRRIVPLYTIGSATGGGDDEGEVRLKPRMVVSRIAKGQRIRILDQGDTGIKGSQAMDIIKLFITLCLQIDLNVFLLLIEY